MSETTPYHQIATCITLLRESPDARAEVEQRLRLLEDDLQAWARQLTSFSEGPLASPQMTTLISESMRGLEMFRVAADQVREYMSLGTETAAQEAIENGKAGLKVILSVKGVTEDAIEHILDSEE